MILTELYIAGRCQQKGDFFSKARNSHFTISNILSISR
jgi:hypothetical protein